MTENIYNKTVENDLYSRKEGRRKREEGIIIILFIMHCMYVMKMRKIQKENK